MSGGQALCMGGTSGLGKATAVELAKKGFNVTLIGRNVGRGEQAVSELEGAGETERSNVQCVWSSDITLVLYSLRTCCQPWRPKKTVIARKLCVFFFSLLFFILRGNPSSLLIACTAAPLSVFFPITAANKSQQFEFVSADLFVSDVKLSPELQLSVPFGPN